LERFTEAGDIMSEEQVIVEQPKRKISPIGYIAIVMLLCLGFGFFQQHQRAEGLTTDVANLQSEVENLESDIENLKSEHEDEIEERDGRIAELEDQVETISRKARNLVSASEDLRSNTDRFSYENWRDVVPDIDSGTSELEDAASNMEMELP
jgi:chromosome segregation ATPase